MSRDEGFTIADISVGILRDRKVRRLRNANPDDADALTLLYVAIVLSSWEEGDRLPADEADTPVTPTPDRVAALRSAELLDGSNRVPEATWEVWFKPAWERRERRRSSGSAGGLRSWDKRRSSNASSDAEANAEPVRPSVRPLPTDRPTRARAREDAPDDTWTTLTREAETLTGKAYALANPHSRLGETARQQVEDFGLPSVVAAWHEVKGATAGRLTIGQLVLGADNLLRPIPKLKPGEPTDPGVANLRARLAAGGKP